MVAIASTTAKDSCILGSYWEFIADVKLEPSIADSFNSKTT